MTPQPRPELNHILPLAHGALDFAELEQLGLSPDQVIDFSVNSDPYGPSPSVWEAMKTVPVDRYPDRETLALRGALARRLGVPINSNLAGNGLSELLWFITLAFIRSGDQVLVIGPTFKEYAKAAALMGAQINHRNALPETHFRIDFDQVWEQREKTAQHLVFLCSPNNPTGQVSPPKEVENLARNYSETLSVVDEAYVAFAPTVET